MTLVPVILSGGTGSRLWPASRAAHPKPFIALPDGDTLIRKTFRRASALIGVDEIMTVTNRDLLFKTEDEYSGANAGVLNESDITLSYILEPFGRNTAAAVAAAALQVHEYHGGDAQLLILAADHLIMDEPAFVEVVNVARRLAADDWLVTFGMEPKAPETGFGYIEANLEAELLGGYQVSSFVEKPDLETAQSWVRSGGYLWNSGIFCARAGHLLEEMDHYCPDVLGRVRQTLLQSRLSEGKRHRTLLLDQERFSAVPDISIDYALMERSRAVATIPCHIGWSDIGSWSTMSELTSPDAQGNRLQGEVLCHEAINNYVQSSDRLIALVGVENLIVVDTPDAFLVANKGHAQEVKQIVNFLKSTGHQAHLHHQTVSRPWGTYTTLEEGDRFKIKRIVVKPGASLSLQMHYHRSEHWVVVSGTARVVNGDEELMLATNESTFIRAGHKHRLENPGVVDLVLIEVQSGDYLGEDDIIRFEDIYGRC